MGKPSEIIGSLFEKGEQYGKTTLELAKLKAIDKLADVVSNAASWFVIIALALLFFVVLNIGAALWLGELLGKLYYGFFAVAGFYALLTLIFWIFRKQLVKKPVGDTLIDNLLE
jgi:hypothetical protein